MDETKSSSFAANAYAHLPSLTCYLRCYALTYHGVVRLNCAEIGRRCLDNSSYPPYYLHIT